MHFYLDISLSRHKGFGCFAVQWFDSWLKFNPLIPDIHDNKQSKSPGAMIFCDLFNKPENKGVDKDTIHEDIVRLQTLIGQAPVYIAA
jgi:hypothetical protein